MFYIEISVFLHDVIVNSQGTLQVFRKIFDSWVWIYDNVGLVVTLHDKYTYL